MARPTLHLIAYPGNKNAWKVLIAAKLRGVEVLETSALQAAAHPLGRVPVLLVGEEGAVFEPHAAARYVAQLGGGPALLGATPLQQAQVAQWLEFSTRELDAPLLSWYLPLLNVWRHDKGTEHAAKDTLGAALRALDAHLEGREWLAGEALSLADIVVACDLYHGFTKLFDERYRSKLPWVTAHFTRCVGLPEFKSILGEVQLCQQPLRHGGGKRGGAPAQQAGGAMGAEEPGEGLAAGGEVETGEAETGELEAAAEAEAIAAAALGDEEDDT